MYPDNFLYFITLFSISIGGGVYLLFNFHRSIITSLNALMFFLCAIRAATEFYVHATDSFQVANSIFIFHSFIGSTIVVLLWGCTYFYIRPLRSHPREGFWSKLLIGTAIPIFIINYYGLFNRVIYSTLPEKINGYWMYQLTENPFWSNFLLFTIIFYSIFILTLFAYDIFITKQKVFFKSILLVSFFIFPFITLNIISSSSTAGNAAIPNLAIILLGHTIIVSWFCSDYRFFQNNFTNAVKDILNSVADLTIYTDLQYQIKFTNTATQELFEMQKIIGNINLFLAAHSSLSVHDVRKEIKASSQEETSPKELTVLVNEKQHTLRLQCKPFYRASQQTGFLFILNNVTELRQNQVLLEQSNQVKDQLFAIIGHDLRKPAIAFRGISKKVNYLLQRNDFQTLKQLGKNWEDAANALNHLINNLLNWALQQRGNLTHQPEVIVLPNAVDNSIEALANTIANKNIDLIVDIPENTKVLADFNSVVTIMRNLLDNAIKFTPTNGYIKVEANIESQQVEIKVSDSGIGMDQHQITTLFQIQKGKNRKGTAGESGTGIGLNLVRELILLNDGEVSVESQVNRGTTIKVRLPSAA